MGTRRNRSELSPLAHLARLRGRIRAIDKACGLVIALLLCVAANADEPTLEIIELQHTMANEVLPLIQPLIEPGGTVTGMHDQVIIKASPANLAEIKRVLAVFDRTPKTLKITVTQDITAHSQTREDALSGRFRSGDFGGRVPDPGARGPGGASVGYRDANGNAVRYRALSTHSSDDRRNSHFVTTVEGRPALIQTGKSIPYPYQSAIYDGYGAVINEGIDYRDLNSGFYVTPRTHGQRVTLDIAPQLERQDPRYPGAIDTRYTETTVSGQLGEWIPLGGVNETGSGEDSALLARTRRQGDENYDIWVKVEEVP